MCTLIHQQLHTDASKFDEKTRESSHFDIWERPCLILGKSDIVHTLVDRMYRDSPHSAVSISAVPGIVGFPNSSR